MIRIPKSSNDNQAPPAELGVDADIPLHSDAEEQFFQAHTKDIYPTLLQGEIKVHYNRLQVLEREYAIANPLIGTVTDKLNHIMGTANDFEEAKLQSIASLMTYFPYDMPGAKVRFDLHVLHELAGQRIYLLADGRIEGIHKYRDHDEDIAAALRKQELEHNAEAISKALNSLKVGPHVVQETIERFDKATDEAINKFNGAGRGR